MRYMFYALATFCFCMSLNTFLYSDTESIILGVIGFILGITFMFVAESDTEITNNFDCPSIKGEGNRNW